MNIAGACELGWLTMIGMFCRHHHRQPHPARHHHIRLKNVLPEQFLCLGRCSPWWWPCTPPCRTAAGCRSCPPRWPPPKGERQNKNRFWGGTKYLEKAKLAIILYLCCGRLAAAPNLLSDHLGKSKVSSQEGCVLNFENAKLKFNQVQSSNLCDWGQSWVAQQWQMIDGGCDSNLDTFAILLLFPIYSKFPQM